MVRKVDSILVVVIAMWTLEVFEGGLFVQHRRVVVSKAAALAINFPLSSCPIVKIGSE
jgi:hypothetical protein